ncbi:DUF5718 family protein [Helicobacter cetorum]|uniref:Valyl-tRNA synthetase n=1 Tax=Helicobacter cetorum (strain ATCC BAA-540 / CCUG 52418 / MIT 99-5656) TaxID=1163745 RepID=I0EQ52_HELCM|nr:DUF5718 family protein [Helicobacter cetorum]AFI05071.1 hypothetical protein HCD_00195 [Helicobacter cetorum MIT 99-5656]
MQEFLGFGVVGNFAGHLEQAGESHSFINMKSEEKDAPKGLFPFYIPHEDSYLGRFCIDNEKIILPSDLSLKVQAEPEVALECEVKYDENHLVVELVPNFFMAFNDTSVRNLDAAKLSQKKNFSSGSKGMGQKLPIDKFAYGGVCNNFSIASFLKRNNLWHVYGENSKLLKYEFFYQKLLDWIKDRLNYQKDCDSLEALRPFLERHSFPTKMVVTIGATPYMPFAQTHFLKKDDEVVIIAYNHLQYSFEKIQNMLEENALQTKEHANISYVYQIVE